MIESTCLVTSLNLVKAKMVKTSPKKVITRKNVFFTFYIPFKNLHVFKRMIHTLLTICTLFNLKELKRF